jgi:hypothetical protein
MVFRRRPPRPTTLAGRKTSSTHHHHRRPSRPTTPTTPSKPPPLHANRQHVPTLFQVRHHTSAQGEAADAMRPHTLRHGGRRLHAPHRTPPLRWSSIPTRAVEPPPPHHHHHLGRQGHRAKVGVQRRHRRLAPHIAERPMSMLLAAQTLLL